MLIAFLDALLLLAAYLIGALSGSLLLGRLRGVDIRTQGSGNAGGTNAFRTQGAKFALGVLVVDIGKGVLAVWLAQRWGSPAVADGLAYAAAFAAVVGHIWPVWHGFRGGKGAATAMGAICMLWPVAVPWLFALWLACLILTGYVGLGTILTALAFAAAALAASVAQADIGLGDIVRSMFACALAALIVFSHRANLARLRAGTESRFEKAMLLKRLRRARAEPRRVD
jgi:glycerol-3-phosphate acyltransferase PlsY